MSEQATALKPAWLVPVVPEGTVLAGHALVMLGDRIADILPVADLAGRWPRATVVDLPGHVLIPGLVNAHTHSAMALMRGLADDLPLMTWLQAHIWPAEQRWVGRDYVRDGSELAIAEMLLGGTTCFNDNYFFPDVTAAVAARAGMRAVIGMPIINVPTAWAANENEYFEKALETHQSLLGEPLVTTTFAPHAPYTVSDAAFERMRALAEEIDLPIHLHLLETAGEIPDSVERFGLKPLARLEKLGLLTPRLLAVHMTQLSPRDIELVARTGVHVLHCPESNLKLASGICPVAALDAAGVNVALGTDGAASNNDLDLFGEMRTAALLAKGHSGNPEAVPAPRALSMATVHGARALGLEARIGSLEVGKQADIVAVDLDRIETQPVHHVISQLVYAVSRSQVTHVWVAGEARVRGGVLTSLDVADIKRRAVRWRSRLAERT